MPDVTCGRKPEAGRTVGCKRIAAILAATLVLASCGHQPVRGNGNPEKPGPPKKVHLVWQANQWKVSLNGNAPVNPATAHTALTRNTDGPTMFEVDIQGSTPATFKDPGGLDVWEGANAKSQPQAGINSTQILGPVVTNNGKRLVFWDLNQGNAVTLNYSLHFNEAGIPSVDPIIDNGGHD